MRMYTKAAILACSMAVAGAANATPLPAFDASYEGIFDIANAYSGHGLYLPSATNVSGATTQWGVTGGTATYVGNMLTIDGSVTNNGASNLSLDFSFTLTENAGFIGSSACGSSAGTGCNTTNAADVAARDEIKFFDLTAATLKGTSGTDLDGLLVNLSVKPGDGSKPPQFGYGGNWRNMDFGYSNWFFYEVEKTATDAKFANAFPGSSWGGDINLTFEGSDDQLEPVPLPAGLPLLLGALGLMGVVNRKRRG